MKVYVRNRHKNYGDPSLIFPYQAVLWFKAEGTEPNWLHRRLAARFRAYLIHEMKWGGGALSRVQTHLAYNSDLTSCGILFSNRKFADEARGIIEKWLYEDGEYLIAMQSSYSPPPLISRPEEQSR